MGSFENILENFSTFVDDNNSWGKEANLQTIIDSIKSLNANIESEMIIIDSFSPDNNTRIVERIMEAKRCMICKEYIDDKGGDMHCSKCADAIFKNMFNFKFHYAPLQISHITIIT